MSILNILKCAPEHFEIHQVRTSLFSVSYIKVHNLYAILEVTIISLDIDIFNNFIFINAFLDVNVRNVDK